MADIRRVELDVDALGHGRVVVDDKDISAHVCRVVVDSKVNQPTKVYVELSLGHRAKVEAEGLVFDTEPDVDSVRQFLENVDAAALEAAAMSKLSGLEGVLDNPIVAALAVLQEWASDGNSDGT